MTTLSYLTRRNGGSFYVQIRATNFSGTRSLLRFSLRTHRYNEARFRLFAYLRWLLPMQSPAEINENIDLILSQIDAFAKEGLAQDAWQAHHRHHYLKAATMLLADWRKAEPCPIRYAHFYAQQRVFAQKLTSLTHLIFEDFDHLGIAVGDPDYLKPPKPSFQYLCDEGNVVAEVVEQEGCPSWPQIPHYLMPDELRIEPEYWVGDTWGRSSLKPTVTTNAEGVEPPLDMPSSVLPTLNQPISSQLTSFLLEKFLAEQFEAPMRQRPSATSSLT